MNPNQLKMNKPRYVIEPSPLFQRNGLFRMRLGDTEEELKFNEWLMFLDELMTKNHRVDFEMHRLFPEIKAILFLYQRGFVLEPHSPHRLWVFTSIKTGMVRQRLIEFKRKLAQNKEETALKVSTLRQLREQRKRN